MKIRLIFLISLITHTAQTQTPYPFATGAKSDASRYYNGVGVIKPSMKSTGNIQGNKDISNPNQLILDQGINKGCVGYAFAAAFSLRWHLSHSKTGLLFSPHFIYNQINQGQDNGSFGIEAYNLLIKQGVCMDTTFQAKSFTDSPPNDAQLEAQQFKMNPSARVFDANYGNHNNTSTKLNNLKQALFLDIPVVIILEIDSAFKHTGRNIWQPDTGKRSQHALVVVGYNDTDSTFRLLNSWGKARGNDGYWRIRYADMEKYVKEAYAVDIEETSLAALVPAPSDARASAVTLQRARSQYKNIKGERLYYFEDVPKPLGSLLTGSGEVFRIVVAPPPTDKVPYFFTINANKEDTLYPLSKLEDSQNRTWLCSEDIERERKDVYDYFCIVFVPKEDTLKIVQKIKELKNTSFGEADAPRRIADFLGNSAVVFKLINETVQIPKQKIDTSLDFQRLKKDLVLCRVVEDLHGGWAIAAKNTRTDAVVFLRFSRQNQLVVFHIIDTPKKLADAELSNIWATADGGFVIKAKGSKDSIAYKIDENGSILYKIDENKQKFELKNYYRESNTEGGILERRDYTAFNSAKDTTSRGYISSIVNAVRIPDGSMLDTPIIPNRTIIPDGTIMQVRNSELHLDFSTNDVLLGNEKSEPLNNIQKDIQKSITKYLEKKRASTVIYDLLATQSGALIAFGKRDKAAWFDTLIKPKTVKTLKLPNLFILKSKGIYDEDNDGRLTANERGYFKIEVISSISVKRLYAVIKPKGYVAEGLVFFDTVYMGNLNAMHSLFLRIPLSIMPHTRGSGRTVFEVSVFSEEYADSLGTTQFVVKSGNIFIENADVFGQNLVFNDAPLQTTIYSTNPLTDKDVVLIELPEGAKTIPRGTPLNYTKQMGNGYRCTVDLSPNTGYNPTLSRRFVVKAGDFISDTIEVLPPQREPILWAISVGIAYNEGKINRDLKYTVADALSIDSLCRQQIGRYYGKVISIALTSNEATTRDNLRTILDSLQNQGKYMFDKDRVIFFISAHGNQKKDTTDFEIVASRDEIYADEDKYWLFKDNILKKLKKLPCPTWVLVDACRNEASTNNKQSDNATMQSSSLDKQCVFKSCSAGQYAFENNKWQHGAFTFAILQALKNETLYDIDASDKDRRALNMTELAKYVQKSVSAMVKEIEKLEQTPVLSHPLKESFLFIANKK